MDIVFDKHISYQKNNEQKESPHESKMSKVSSKSDFDSKNFPDYHYMLTNFEPWTLNKMM